jgi:peptidoglycan lytic transglycosylase G
LRKVLILLLAVVLAAGGWLAWALLMPVSPATQKFVLLRPGYSTRRIARELEAAGVIRSARAFTLWHYLHSKRSLKAGEYLFEKTADIRQVHERLARGDIYVHTVVIPEGYSIFDIAQAMENAGLGSSQDFLKLATSDTSLIADLDPEARSLEGYLFPNTYEFTRTQSMQEMAGAMVKQFRQVAKKIGLTSDFHRTVTMASIVEKETSAADERPLVASVYYNRLEKKIALQADPTVIYGLRLQGAYTGALHHDDMRTNSPYNTYRYPGLPPGPIGNPGRGALEAALHPASSNYFYFVADGNGRHRFSESFKEHTRNVAKYRKIMLQR